MIHLFNAIKSISWVAIASSLLGSLLMFYIGAKKTFFAIKFGILGTEGIEASLESLGKGDVATVYVIKSLDAFLIGFVLFIFAYGIYRLFVCDDREKSPALYEWIRFPGIGHLKSMLAEVILIILFVKFLEIVLTRAEQLEWNILVLPVAILLLGLALKFMNLKDENQDI